MAEPIESWLATKYPKAPVKAAEGAVFEPQLQMDTTLSPPQDPVQKNAALMARNAGTGERMAQGLRAAVDTAVDHPIYNAAQMIPVVNMPLAATAYASHVARGNTGEAMLDAVNMIPAAPLARMIPKAWNMTRGAMNAHAMRVSTIANGLQAATGSASAAE